MVGTYFYVTCTSTTDSVFYAQLLKIILFSKRHYVISHQQKKVLVKEYKQKT